MLDIPDPDNWYIGEQGEKGNNQVYDSEDCVKMFLAANDVVLENGNTLEVEGDSGNEMVDQEGLMLKKIVYEKEYEKIRKMTRNASSI